MHFLEPFVGDVGVNLGRADAGVAEQFLDRAQINAFFLDRNLRRSAEMPLLRQSNRSFEALNAREGRRPA